MADEFVDSSHLFAAPVDLHYGCQRVPLGLAQLNYVYELFLLQLSDGLLYHPDIVYLSEGNLQSFEVLLLISSLRFDFI